MKVEQNDKQVLSFEKRDKAEESRGLNEGKTLKAKALEILSDPARSEDAALALRRSSYNRILQR